MKEEVTIFVSKTDFGLFFSQINSGIAQFSTKRHKNNRPSVSFYKDYWYQRTTQWVKFYGFG